ncbi:MAG: 3'-5' exoribonuclease YhaM [Firmicutes bacterium]|nr:3'-5' exoribonuclease YhaM [candidate division NPL-UPA2 bacterium]
MRTGGLTKIYAKDLVVGAQVKSHFFVIEKRLVNYNKNGVPACGMVLSLGDRTGRVSAVAWNEALTSDNSYRKDDIVLVSGRVQDYRGDKQIYIEEITRAKLTEIDASDFSTPPPRPLADMWGELLVTMASIETPCLRELLDLHFSLPEVRHTFQQAPAGRDVHHAFVGGLLMHTLEVIAYVERMVQVQGTRLNRDLLIVGAILHDAAKTEEYEPRAFGFEVTDRGKLIGHVVLGAELVGNLTERIPAFPQALRDELKHLVLSHHGQREWGSPEEPKTANAVALHLADYTSSRLAQVEKIIAETVSLGERWSAWDKRLERSILADVWEGGGGEA